MDSGEFACVGIVLGRHESEDRGFESQSCLLANGSTNYSGDAAALGRDQEGFSPFLTTSHLDPTPDALRH